MATLSLIRVSEAAVSDDRRYFSLYRLTDRETEKSEAIAIEEEKRAKIAPPPPEKIEISEG
jgi:hypothetical protein